VKIPRDRWPQIAIAVVVIGALFGVSHLLGSIDIENALHDVSHSLGAWTYALVGLAAFLETGAFVGLVLPGESVVILGGAVAGQGATSVIVTIAVVWVCAFAGDSASFLLGSHLGKDFILRHGPKLRITEERFAKVESYFHRYGGRTILIGRFIGLVRALAPFTAGSSGMRYRDFFPYSLLGTGLWSATFSLVGYFASQHLDAAANAAGKSTFYFGATVALIVGVVMGVRYLRVEENRARLEERLEQSRSGRWLLAAGRRIRPQARFALARVTPGDLGLELTAILAAAAVGTFVVIAQATTLEPNTGPLAIDTWAFDVLDSVRTAWLTDVAKGISDLGSTGAMLIVGVVGSGVLAARRRWADLAVLIAGLILVTIATDSLKAAVDRHRPSDPLVQTSLSSYPSGHAAHSIVYVWIALAIALRATPPNARRTAALIIGGVVIAALVGISRVYLHAHYASDVLGGWALGVAVFSLLAAAALVVTHLRKTPAGR
jgi:membrane protein DedA with SNARE-associated domain/membrane-associated phospholipid phosphatase